MHYTKKFGAGVGKGTTNVHHLQYTSTAMMAMIESMYFGQGTQLIF